MNCRSYCVPPLWPLHETCGRLSNVIALNWVLAFISVTLTYVLGPATQELEKRGLGRTGAVGLLFLAGLSALVGAVLYIVPALTDESEKLPAFFHKALDRILPVANKYLGIHLTNNVNKLFSQLGEKVAEMGQDIFPVIFKALGSTASILVALLGLLIVPVISFHFMRESNKVLALAETLIPPRFQSHFRARFGQVDRKSVV